MAILSFIYGFLGEKREAERCLQFLVSESKAGRVPASDFAFAYAGLGDKDRFFDYLMKSVDDRSSFPAMVRSHPFVAGLRPAPRFGEYLAARERAAKG